jgi:hypothetical protein
MIRSLIVILILIPLQFFSPKMGEMLMHMLMLNLNVFLMNIALTRIESSLCALSDTTICV